MEDKRDNIIATACAIAKEFLESSHREEHAYMFKQSLGISDINDIGGLLSPIMYASVVDNILSHTMQSHVRKGGALLSSFLGGDYGKVVKIVDTLIRTVAKDDLNDPPKVPLTDVDRNQLGLIEPSDEVSEKLVSNPWYLYYCILVIFGKDW